MLPSNQLTLPSNKGSVLLLASLMSITALSIDAMLPALGIIGDYYSIENQNDAQLIITALFIGMSFGLIFFGPLSDAIGRKKSIYIGLLIFIIGCLGSILATSFNAMIIFRIIQGLGVASTRVVTLAIIRDQFEGNQMARTMSLVLIVLMVVPALAPSIGQIILLFAEWKLIFGFMIFIACVNAVWFSLKQPETLLPENRIKFTFLATANGIKETLRNPATRGYTIMTGLIFGSLLGYLNSAQQIFQDQYNLGAQFSIYFGSLAVSTGVASYTNSRLVLIKGMHKLCLISLVTLSMISLGFAGYSHLYSGNPPLAALMMYLLITFFCFGILFGNINALALQPLGHIAGVANSVVGCIQTVIAALLGWYIGSIYDGTVTPLVLGFLCLGTLSLLIFLVIRNKN